MRSWSSALQGPFTVPFSSVPSPLYTGSLKIGLGANYLFTRQSHADSAGVSITALVLGQTQLKNKSPPCRP
jgi:hypothetical protein